MYNLKIKVLAPSRQEDDRDFGDCFIINDNGKVIVYDCGSEELADQVLDYLSDNNIDMVDVVLSHNDSDHFNGIPKLVDAGVVSSITTLLLLKYKDEIFKKIEDGRVSKNSLEEHIIEMYDNIYSLSGNNLIDALDTAFKLSDNVKVVGPSEDYFIVAVAKQFTPTESNNIDNSTIMNAISVQLEINFGNKKILLTGDADFAAFEDKICDYDAIQLPHHGNSDMAELIFDKNKNRNNVLYIVSDNKGKNINGGSAKLNNKGHYIKNTQSGSFEIDDSSFNIETKGNLCSNEIYFTKSKNF